MALRVREPQLDDACLAEQVEEFGEQFGGRVDRGGFGFIFGFGGEERGGESQDAGVVEPPLEVKCRERGEGGDDFSEFKVAFLGGGIRERGVVVRWSWGWNASEERGKRELTNV